MNPNPNHSFASEAPALPPVAEFYNVLVSQPEPGVTLVEPVQLTRLPGRSTLPERRTARLNTRAEADAVLAKQEASRPLISEIEARYCAVTGFKQDGIVLTTYVLGSYLIRISPFTCGYGRSLLPITTAMHKTSGLTYAVLIDTFTLLDLEGAEYMLGGTGI